jgi:hypothetical protein
VPTEPIHGAAPAGSGRPPSRTWPALRWRPPGTAASIGPASCVEG